MTYKAIKRVGIYKIGDVVPDDLAIRWNHTYEFPHCELVKDEVIVKVEQEKPLEEHKIEWIIPNKEEDVKPEDDLNKDGIIDTKDSSLAGKVLGKFGKRKKR